MWEWAKQVQTTEVLNNKMFLTKIISEGPPGTWQKRTAMYTYYTEFGSGLKMY
jgi:hypothetical protein